MDSSSNQIGTVVRFSGFVGPVDELTRTSPKLTVNSATAYLNMQLPSIILQTGCTNTLFDPRCGLLKASFANNLVAQSGSSPTSLTPKIPGMVVGNGSPDIASATSNPPAPIASMPSEPAAGV